MATSVRVSHQRQIDRMLSRKQIDVFEHSIALALIADHRQSQPRLVSTQQRVGGPHAAGAERTPLAIARLGAALDAAGPVGKALLIDVLFYDRPAGIAAARLGYSEAFGQPRLREALRTIADCYVS